MSALRILKALGMAPRAAGEPSDIETAERELRVRLPDDYRTFLQESDGLEGFAGPDSYLILWSARKLPELNATYNVAEFAPGLVLIGTDGGGTAYGFLKRGGTNRYVQVQLIGLSRDAFEVMGDSFVEMIARLRRDDPSDA